MDKIVFNDEISKDKLLELTANKVQELIEGYNEIKEKHTKHISCIYDEIEKLKRKDTVVWREYKRLIKEDK